MNMWKKLAGGVAFTAFATAIVQPAMAQQTTSGVGGTVSLADDTAAAGASVTLTDTRTGFTRTTVTNTAGSFGFLNQQVGGPYTVDVKMAGQQPIRVSDISLTLGQPTNLNLKFSGSTVSDIVVITGSSSSAQVAKVAIGPSSTFSLEDLQTQPAINRDLKDVIRADPRIYLDESAGGTAGSDGIQCGGASPRFNSLTVDGVGLNDGFGLNNNGYPTERMPFPFDAINQVSVELAPFDVQYSGFTGCAINAVTKSGSNTFHGGVFFDYTDDSMRSHTFAGSKIFVPTFEEKRYGGTLSGPIVPDKLFFFGAYEKFEGSNLFFRGPEGSGQPNIITGLTQAAYDRIVNASKNIYGYDPGGTQTSNPTVDEKYLARLDWNISDRHRLNFTYNYAKGLNLTESDSNQVTQFEFSKHLYDKGTELKAYSTQLFSDWTDQFSTEFRVSYNDVDNTVLCRDGAKVGEVQIQFSGRTIFLGCDDSRHSNDLNYTVLSLKGKATYRAGEHLISAGVERQTYDIFNQFVQNTEGQFIFTSIDAFEQGLPSTIVYQNAKGSNDPNDASAKFKYSINTIYLQDEVDVTDTARVTLGLRYDFYDNEDKPPYNAAFAARNGFSNTENLTGKSIVQPRLGFDWDITDRLKLRGGAGLFSGGNPNVWVSNSYSNDGIRLIRAEARSPLAAGFPLAQNILTTPNVGDERGAGQTVNPNGALWGIPSYLYTAVANGSADATTNAIDPNFQPASEWKFSIGGTYAANLGFLGDDYLFTVDYIRTQTNDAATVIDNALERVGTAIDGSPIYKRIDRTDPDCNNAATVNTSACTTRSANDLILTNSGQGHRNIFSIGAQKSYDWGFDWSAGYAHTEATDTRSMTSSVAFSNWTANSTIDINNPIEATSNYEIPNRFTMRLAYEHEWFTDFKTKFSLFGQAYQARPYSINFSNGGLNDIWGDGQESLHQLYIPTGPNDPNVIFCGAPGATNLAACNTSATNTTKVVFDTDGFFKWADATGLARGQIVGRNSQEGSWTNKFDFKVEQQFPTIFGRGSVYAVVENIGNLLNDKWGVSYESPFPQQNRMVVADRDAATNKYVYRQVFAVAPEGAVSAISFWTIKVGVDWKF